MLALLAGEKVIEKGGGEKLARKGCGLHFMFRPGTEGVSPLFQREEQANSLEVQASLEFSRAGPT